MLHQQEIDDEGAAMEIRNLGASLRPTEQRIASGPVDQDMTFQQRLQALEVARNTAAVNGARESLPTASGEPWNGLQNAWQTSLPSDSSTWTPDQPKHFEDVKEADSLYNNRTGKWSPDNAKEEEWTPELTEVMKRFMIADRGHVFMDPKEYGTKYIGSDQEKYDGLKRVAAMDIGHGSSPFANQDDLSRIEAIKSAWSHNRPLPDTFAEFEALWRAER